MALFAIFRPRRDRVIIEDASRPARRRAKDRQGRVSTAVSVATWRSLTAVPPASGETEGRKTPLVWTILAIKAAARLPDH